MYGELLITCIRFQSKLSDFKHEDIRYYVRSIQPIDSLAACRREPSSKAP